MPPFDLSAFLNLVGYAVLTGGAAVWLRSNIRKQNHQELENLAETRGQRISDQDEKIRRLEHSVAELRGQMAAMQALKASEIADEVVVRLTAANFGKNGA